MLRLGKRENQNGIIRGEHDVWYAPGVFAAHNIRASAAYRLKVSKLYGSLHVTCTRVPGVFFRVLRNTRWVINVYGYNE